VTGEGMSVGVVVPARDEAARISGVLSAVVASGAVVSLVTVCDSCTDATEQIAARYGDTLTIDAADKGTAMAAGLATVTAELVLFLDADLVGFTAGHVAALAALPPAAGQLVGMIPKLPGVTVQANLPSFAGQRRLPVSVAARAGLDGAGWEAETRLNATVARLGLPWDQIVLEAVSNPTKATARPLGWVGQAVEMAAAVATYGPALARYATHPQGAPGRS
jgi:glycosyltransferase involved in cell wall biosynthesis